METDADDELIIKQVIPPQWIHKDTQFHINPTGSFIIGNSPEQFAQQMAAELAVYQRVVKEQNLKLDQ